MADRRFQRNGGNHLRARPFQSVAPAHRMNSDHGPCRYVLIGFDCLFLAAQNITFVHPLPNDWVCAGCAVVAATAVRLPCGHTLCWPCAYDAVARATARRHQDESAATAGHDGLCPEEGAPFAEHQLEDVTFPLEELRCHNVLCVNADLGCLYCRTLRDLPEHIDNVCYYSRHSLRDGTSRPLNRRIILAYMSQRTGEEAAQRATSADS
ncbi:hypothetical protein MTO96_025060 [Rhipicephalus appendiculatus]